MLDVLQLGSVNKCFNVKFMEDKLCFIKYNSAAHATCMWHLCTCDICAHVTHVLKYMHKHVFVLHQIQYNSAPLFTPAVPALHVIIASETSLVSSSPTVLW